jgi:hypothetical protein
MGTARNCSDTRLRVGSAELPLAPCRTRHEFVLDRVRVVDRGPCHDSLVPRWLFRTLAFIRAVIENRASARRTARDHMIPGSCAAGS